jgi:hypothetical protein
MLILADAIEQILDSPAPVIALVTMVAVVAIISGCARRIVMSQARERTRRELAAYVAEGTLDPDKAIEMLKAGEKDQGH